MQTYCCPNNVTSTNWAIAQQDTGQTHIQCTYYNITSPCVYVSIITYIYIHCFLASRLYLMCSIGWRTIFRGRMSVGSSSAAMRLYLPPQSLSDSWSGSVIMNIVQFRLSQVAPVIFVASNHILHVELTVSVTKFKERKIWRKLE